MKRTRIFRVAVLLSPLILAAGCKSRPIEKQVAREAAVPRPTADAPITTIRNVTQDLLQYTVRRADAAEVPVEKTLTVGEIHSYPTDWPLQIAFQRGDTPVTYRLEAGKPYSFRYDEFDDVYIYPGAHGREDVADLAPFVPTPMEVVDKLLEAAELDADDVLYDLGCGDGRIVVGAAARFGARAVGVDIVAERIDESWARARAAGVEHLVEFYREDATLTDISEATVVAVYLLPESLEILKTRFEAQLEPGSLVISHDYRIPGWEKKLTATAEITDELGVTRKLFSYRR